MTSSGAVDAPGESEPALVVSGGTHPGLRRPNNEDSAYLGERLLVVADGMGGVDFGEANHIERIPDLAPDAPLEAWR